MKSVNYISIAIISTILGCGVKKSGSENGIPQSSKKDPIATSSTAQDAPKPISQKEMADLQSKNPSVFNNSSDKKSNTGGTAEAQALSLDTSFMDQATKSVCVVNLIPGAPQTSQPLCPAHPTTGYPAFWDVDYIRLDTRGHDVYGAQSFSNINSTRCLQRASEYAKWCFGPGDRRAVDSAFYIYDMPTATWRSPGAYARCNNATCLWWNDVKTAEEQVSDSLCSTNIAYTYEMPFWVNSFMKCSSIYLNSSSMVITTRSLPNYKSYYYDPAGPWKSFRDQLPSGNHANPNYIGAQNYTFTIPIQPKLNLEPTPTGLDAVGVSVNSVVIFNNRAAPGESLANEAYTFDAGAGHPAPGGVYHYHMEPKKITNNDGRLVGVMRDGFLVYGKKEIFGAEPVYNDNCNTQNAMSVQNCRPYPVKMPNFHCHWIEGFSSSVCHSHVVSADPYIAGYYAGTPGIMTK